MLELLNVGLIGRNDHPAYNVRVTIQEFRCGMDDQIRAEVDRLLQCRGEESVIDHDLRSHIPRLRRDRPDINDTHQWIARSFDEDQLWAACQSHLEHRLIALVDECYFELSLRLSCIQQAPCSSITVVWCDDEISWFQTSEAKVDCG